MRDKRDMPREPLRFSRITASQHRLPDIDHDRIEEIGRQPTRRVAKPLLSMLLGDASP
jgi:hypothetical protein